jgi:hypothetical protein
MIKVTNVLYAALQEALKQIGRTSDDTIKTAERSYNATQDTMHRLKEFVLTYEFKDQDEEIQFFKKIKPMFLKDLIYYMEVYYVEAGKPVGNIDAQKSFLRQELERINIFFERNHTLYIYYRMDKSNLDHVYFVREVSSDLLQPEYMLDIDPRFSTIQSFKLAKMQAYETLNGYLQNASYVLDHPGIISSSEAEKKTHNSWTDSKASLIELAYAIHSRGAINHGKGDVKQIITALEVFFNVELGNFYRTFQSMRIRKKSRTPFLDTLKESLERKMDNTDLGY